MAARIPETRGVGVGPRASYMRRGIDLLHDTSGDPLDAMGSLFDVAILIGVGFMIVALAGFGLKELVTAEDVTIVKAPGQADMEIITKQAGRIQKLKRTDELATGEGYAIGTVYRLEDGSVIWVQGEGE
jgi:hypothetical protein